MKVTKDMIIADLLIKERSMISFFNSRNWNCLCCAAANKETIADVAMAHSIDLEQLIKEMNEYLEQVDKDSAM